MSTASIRRRRRGLYGLAIAGALSLSFMAPAASAQIYGGYGGGLGSQGIIGGGGFYGGQTSVVGTINGSVRSLDFESGRLVMETVQGPFALNAKPQDLVGLNPGDVASVTFLNYNGARWLAPGGGYGGFGGGYGGGIGSGFAFSGEVTGTVQRVDRQRGLLTVAGRTLRAHPEDVSDVYPGQFISVGYVQVGKSAWAETGYGGGMYGGGFGGGGMYGGGIGIGGGGIGGGGIYGGGMYGGGGFGGGNVGGGNVGGGNVGGGNVGGGNVGGGNVGAGNAGGGTAGGATGGGNTGGN